MKLNMNENETSLQLVENQGILKKIVNFFKKISCKKETNYTFFSDIPNTNNAKPNDFFNSLKYTEDPEEKKLLKIQEDLEKIGINQQNVYILTKELTEVQKEKLLQLYNVQINDLNTKIERLKSNIIKIRKRI